MQVYRFKLADGTERDHRSMNESAARILLQAWLMRNGFKKAIDAETASEKAELIAIDGVPVAEPEPDRRIGMCQACGDQGKTKMYGSDEYCANCAEMLGVDE